MSITKVEQQSQESSSQSRLNNSHDPYIGRDRRSSLMVNLSSTSSGSRRSSLSSTSLFRSRQYRHHQRLTSSSGFSRVSTAGKGNSSLAHAIGDFSFHEPTGSSPSLASNLLRSSIANKQLARASCYTTHKSQPSSAPPLLTRPSYCASELSTTATATAITSTPSSERVHDIIRLDREAEQVTNEPPPTKRIESMEQVNESVDKEASSSLGGQLNSSDCNADETVSSKSILVVSHRPQTAQRDSGGETGDQSPQPIVEIKDTSESSSSSSSACSSAPNSNPNSRFNSRASSVEGDEDECESSSCSTRLVRRRTVKRYSQRQIEELGSANSRVTTSPSSPQTTEFTISINRSDDSKAGRLVVSSSSTSGSAQTTTSNQHEESSRQQHHHHHQQQQQATNTKSHFRTQQIGNFSATQKQHRESFVNEEASTSKCSITTNRKSTTRQLISSSQESSKSQSKATKMIKPLDCLVLTRASEGSTSTTAAKDSPSKRYLGERVNYQNGDASLIERSSRSVQVKEQQEEHHSRFSSSTLTGSANAAELRASAAASRRYEASSTASTMSMSSSSSNSLLNQSGVGGAASQKIISSSSSATCNRQRHARATSFLSGGQSETLFSPDMRSLVNEIGTDFAELEQALTLPFGASQGPLPIANQGASSGLVPASEMGLSASASSASSTITSGSVCGSNSGRASGSLGAASSLSSRFFGSTRTMSSGAPLAQLYSRHARLGSNEVPVDSGTFDEWSQSGADSNAGHSRSNSQRIRELLSKAHEAGSATNSHERTPFGMLTPTEPAEGSSTPTSRPSRISTGEQVLPMGALQALPGSTPSSGSSASGPKGSVELVEQCKAVMSESIERIDQRMAAVCKKLNEASSTIEILELLKLMIQMIEKAWSVPVCGDDLGFRLCNSLREAGGLDIILGFIREAELADSGKPFTLKRAGSDTSLDDATSENTPCSPLEGPPGGLSVAPVVRRQADQVSSAGEEKPEAAGARPMVSAKMKNSNSHHPLRLSIPQKASSELDDGALSTPEQVERQGSDSKQSAGGFDTTSHTKDSDSDILTSDLGLDSTSVESLAFVSAASQAPTSVAKQPKAQQGHSNEKSKKFDVVDENNEEDLASSKPTTEADRKSTADNAEEFNNSLSDTERENQAKELAKEDLVYLSARLLSQCLTFENRNYIVENGLSAVVQLACDFTTSRGSRQQLSQSAFLLRQPSSGRLILVESSNNQGGPARKISVKMSGKSQEILKGSEMQAKQTKIEARAERQQQQVSASDMYAIVGTEILQHLFKHSEEACSRMISMGGLPAILYACRSTNKVVLRHCASALANLALYGGPDSQQSMIEQKAHVWLFPLAFNKDDNVQYYACLAIVVLVANQEIEADVLKSSTLDLVEPFVTSHEPRKFAESTTSHIHGQSATWLRRLIPLLESKRDEARNLACFHFAMEAHIKREQGQTHVFKEIGAVEPLRKIGSSPLAIASKFACQALRLIGEKEPHKLSQQVPLWTGEDVVEWVSQIGFEPFKSAFVDSRVDGDLLLQLDEESLKNDIGINNGIIRRRFLRELSNLKKIADYSSIDKTGLCALFGPTGNEFIQYMYPMLQLGVSKDNIHWIDTGQLLSECKITNTIHRLKLAQTIKELQDKLAHASTLSDCSSNDGSNEKTLDVFVSYRRSTGSQLASLLKVHLQLRGFSVFIDVERLEAGKFDNNLLDSIKAAKNFILVLSPNALDRCIGDYECKDWVHKEIKAALASNCNIIPIIDNFYWPDADQLPEDMRSITYFNGIRWIHDYQDACVDKLERFIRGEISNGSIGFTGSASAQLAGPGSGQSTLQRLTAGNCNGFTSAITPSIGATPSITSFGGTRTPYELIAHPLSNQSLEQSVSPVGYSRRM